MMNRPHAKGASIPIQPRGTPTGYVESWIPQERAVSENPNVFPAGNSFQPEFCPPRKMFGRSQLVQPGIADPSSS